MSELLTAEEHTAMNLTATLWNTLNRVVGRDQSRPGDLAEIANHIHALQHTIMSQAAARAYPLQFRLLGETLAPPPHPAGRDAGHG